MIASDLGKGMEGSGRGGSSRWELAGTAGVFEVRHEDKAASIAMQPMGFV